MRAQFVFSEIGIGLRRNLTMTIAVVLSAAVSLTLFGMAVLVRKQADTMKTYWYDKVQVSIHLCPKESLSPNCATGLVTADQRGQIERDLNQLPLVKKVYYETPKEAYQRFKEYFEDSPIGETVTPDQLGESFHVQLDDPTKFGVVYDAFTGRPGVEQVEDQRALLKNVFTFLNILQRGAEGIALITLVVAMLLIVNTIRLAAFSRRRETGIMRLVGASNFYIQLPFLMEGAIAGAIGAGIASVLVIIGKYVGVDRVLRPNIHFTKFIGWEAVWATLPLLFLLGVLMSALVSALTIRRYMRV